MDVRRCGSAADARRRQQATAEFEWDAGDRLLEYKAPTGAVWSWSYDSAARLIEAAEPGGAIRAGFELGAVTHVRTTGGETDRDDAYAYDARGLLLTAETNVGKFQYTYDAAGRVVTIDGPHDNDDETWVLDRGR